jgi:hypothetical protein
VKGTCEGACSCSEAAPEGVQTDALCEESDAAKEHNVALQGTVAGILDVLKLLGDALLLLFRENSCAGPAGTSVLFLAYFGNVSLTVLSNGSQGMVWPEIRPTNATKADPVHLFCSFAVCTFSLACYCTHVRSC